MNDGELQTSNGIAATIEKWSHSNTDKVLEAHYQKGGWEGWAQVELAIALRIDHGSVNGSNQIFVTREDRVYEGTDDKSDIMLTTAVNGVGKWYNSIELKCEGYYNSKAFLGLVKKDLDQISGPGIKKEYLPCLAWVCAISVSKEAEVKMGEFLKGYPTGKKYVLKQNNDYSLCLWEWRKDFKK